MRASESAVDTANEKDISTATALAAIAGFELVRMADGGFVISKWGLLRSLKNMAEVNDFLAAVGAR